MRRKKTEKIRIWRYLDIISQPQPSEPGSPGPPLHNVQLGVESAVPSGCDSGRAHYGTSPTQKTKTKKPLTTTYCPFYNLSKTSFLPRPHVFYVYGSSASKKEKKSKKSNKKPATCPSHQEKQNIRSVYAGTIESVIVLSRMFAMCVRDCLPSTLAKFGEPAPQILLLVLYSLQSKTFIPRV